MSVRTRVITLIVAALWASARLSEGQLAPRPSTSGALAPALTGLGTLHMPVTTLNARAQAFFDQGLRLLYAFNHAEARRAFQEAARLDSALAMARWGEAMTLAVNLNAPMPHEQGRLAYHAAQLARRLASSASPKERALIDALVAHRDRRSTAPMPTR
jgi:hypothetical protein